MSEEQEFQLFRDLDRIADALEKIAENLEVVNIR